MLVPRIPKLNAGQPVDAAVHAWETRPWLRAQEQIAEAVHRRAMFERVRRGEPVMGRRRVWRPQQRGFLLNPWRFGTGTTDPHFASVVLLCHFDGTNGQATTTDSSSYGRSIGQRGSPTLSTTQARFGATSSGVSTDQAWQITDAAELRHGTAQQTSEGWVYSTGTNSFGGWYAKGVNTTGGLSYGINNTSATFRADGTNDLTGTFSSIANTWVHTANVRDASNVRRIYVGGFEEATDTLNYNNNDTSVLELGQVFNTSFSFLGYLDEVRITNGVCRYPSGTSFTPPSAAFPNS